MVSVLFGLSMDYQVFLVSRMYEEWLETGDNRRAVRVGLAETSRVINSAAVIMIAVFLAFVLSGDRVIAMFGIALAAAVALDAFVLRTLLVPALMHMLGGANWWLPRAGWTGCCRGSASNRPSAARPPTRVGKYRLSAMTRSARRGSRGCAGAADGEGATMFAISLGDDGAELRPLEPWQAEEFLAHMDRGREFVGSTSPSRDVVADLDSARAFLGSYAEKAANDAGRIYGIWTGGTLVGGVLFRTFDVDVRHLRGGLLAGAPAVGKGLVTRACRVIIDWAVEERGIHRVEWHASADERASIAVARRLGMTPRGRAAGELPAPRRPRTTPRSGPSSPPSGARRRPRSPVSSYGSHTGRLACARMDTKTTTEKTGESADERRSAPRAADDRRGPTAAADADSRHRWPRSTSGRRARPTDADGRRGRRGRPAVRRGGGPASAGIGGAAAAMVSAALGAVALTGTLDRQGRLRARDPPRADQDLRVRHPGPADLRDLRRRLAQPPPWSTASSRSRPPRRRPRAGPPAGAPPGSARSPSPAPSSAASGCSCRSVPTSTCS